MDKCSKKIKREISHDVTEVFNFVYMLVTEAYRIFPDTLI